MFQRISEGGFPRVTGDFRRGFDSGPRVGRTLGNEPTHRTALDRPTGDELPAATGGPAAAVRVQPVGGVRGWKRSRASVPRSNLPADRFGKDLGPWGGSDFAIAVVRDGAARRTREEIARISVESQRLSTLIRYATVIPFAIGFLEAALAIDESNNGIWRIPITFRNCRSATSRPEPTHRSI